MRAPWFPEPPNLAHSHRASAPIEPRYEDIAQDGRVTVLGFPHAIGQVVWRHVLSREPAHRELLQQGVVPILSRLVIEATEDPMPVTRPMTGRGGYELTHSATPGGEVDRLLLDIHVEVHGKRGRQYRPDPTDGEEVPVGRIFAEHIYTRPWGPPETRKVVALEATGVPRVPERRRDFRPLERAASLPDGATLLDAEPVVDPCPIVFGMMHTDSNQHVNSLVYLRLFEEALVRRHGSGVLARWLEVGYRKPCFAGDRVRVQLQAFQRGDEVGAFGVFVPEAGGKPYCYLAMGAR